MKDNEKITEVEVVNSTALVEEDETVNMIIKFKKPYLFEGNEYNEIDLNGLDDMQASDMIWVNNYMKRTSPGIDVMPEVSMEYACVLASKAVGQPIEFFMNLPPREAMKVKSRVMAFLFGSE